MPPTLQKSWFTGICEQSPTPFLVTGWIRRWLTNHFSDVNYLENQDSSGPKLNFIWTDSDDTNLVIESITKWEPNLTENRPAIIIKRGPWKKIRLGMDDRHMGYILPSGETQHENWWQGSHIIFCITNSGAEAELLAAEVYSEMQKFGPVIRKILNLKKFEVSGVGDVNILEESRQNFVVPIEINYIYSEVWSVSQSGEPINSFNFML